MIYCQPVNIMYNTCSHIMILCTAIFNFILDQTNAKLVIFLFKEPLNIRSGHSRPDCFGMSVAR